MAKQSIYTVGGTVQASGGLYIPRKADEDWLALCREGIFAYVLTSRQVGKSSLMVRTAERLTHEGIRSVIIDLTQIGIQVTAEEWHLGLLTAIADDLMLEIDMGEWWQAHTRLAVTQRLTKFFQEVLLGEVAEPVVIFKVWEVASGQELLTLSGHAGRVLGIAFSLDGTRLATTSTDKLVQLYALNIQDLMALARTRVTRSLTSEECRKYLHVEKCPPTP